MNNNTTIPGKVYAIDRDTVINSLESSRHGLSNDEAVARLKTIGPNTIPREKPPGLFIVFIRQFISPLTYILVAAAVLSIVIEEHSDAIFITAVLLLNAIIGTTQEFSAQRATTALQQMVTTRCRVLRGGDGFEIDSEQLVPGDILLLESGERIAADVRLLNSHDMEVDESLLTGESIGVFKDANVILDPATVLGDRCNMAFAGTLVNRGSALSIVVATALGTELGTIAATVLKKKPPKAPLLIRMEIFTQRVAMIVALAALLLTAVAFFKGTPLSEVFLLAVALAVSAIPEGLPVALTVALAIGMRRMAKRNVIIRRLVAVEALGSCTYIATDKTGTLTVNQLTVRRILLADGDTWEVTGEGLKPDGAIVTANGALTLQQETVLERLCKAAVLNNSAFLGHRDGGWTHHGDAVDVALLVMAYKAGIRKAEMTAAFPEIETIPFESELLFSASLNQVGSTQQAFVKGAVERLLPMCNRMITTRGDAAIKPEQVQQHANQLAKQGYRVLALASGNIDVEPSQMFSDTHLQNMTLLGLVGMIDPLRTEAKAAIASSHSAGVKVAMVTGDHPATALAIARELELADDVSQIVTGPQLTGAVNTQEFDQLTTGAQVFARVEPNQKFDIVQSLQRGGHFVAVSGDGANDAPALRAAHIGVAMGKSGTDVARETAGLIITDDNFSSIVAGIEEGRIAHANVRKVIFLLISTGAAEIVLFTLALLTGQPLPLVAVQLLWLNLVTNGIQDVALAFEPGEGNELKYPPRSPKEPIFNRLMIERVMISALAIGIEAFLVFQWLLTVGYSIEEARNLTMLLMVLFENVHVFNSRSETISAFLHNPLRNPLLIFGTIIAQLIHIGAMHTPWVSDVLQIQPVSMENWLKLLLIAISILFIMELHKLFWNKVSSLKQESRKLRDVQPREIVDSSE